MVRNLIVCTVSTLHIKFLYHLFRGEERFSVLFISLNVVVDVGVFIMMVFKESLTDAEEVGLVLRVCRANGDVRPETSRGEAEVYVVETELPWCTVYRFVVGDDIGTDPVDGILCHGHHCGIIAVSNLLALREGVWQVGNVVVNVDVSGLAGDKSCLCSRAVLNEHRTHYGAVQRGAIFMDLPVDVIDADRQWNNLLWLAVEDLVANLNISPVPVGLI